MESGEGNEVDGQLPEVRVELTGEPEAAGDSGHGSGDQVVEISVGGSGELEGSEADVVECLVVDDHALVGVLDQLMHGQSGVVGLHNGVGHLGRRHH